MSLHKQLFRFYFLPVGLEMQPVKIYIILQLMLLFFLFFFLSNVWDQFSCAVAHLTGLKLIFILHFLFPSWDTFTSCGFFFKKEKKNIDEPLFHTYEAVKINSGTCSQRIWRGQRSAGWEETKKELNRHELEDFILLEQKRFYSSLKMMWRQRRTD